MLLLLLLLFLTAVAAASVVFLIFAYSWFIYQPLRRNPLYFKRLTILVYWKTFAYDELVMHSGRITNAFSQGKLDSVKNGCLALSTN